MKLNYTDGSVVAQRLCSGHPGVKSYAYDKDSDLWVCSGCGLPSQMYYLARRATQPPGVPVPYAQGWERLKSQRGRTVAHH